MSVEYRPVEDEPKAFEKRLNESENIGRFATELTICQQDKSAKFKRQRDHLIGIAIVLLLLLLSVCGALLQKACGG